MNIQNLISIFKTPDIEFLYDEGIENVIIEPTPANKKIPDWFKKAPTYVKNAPRDEFGAIPMGAKKCLPLIDAMSAGYVITLQGDVNIRTNKDCRLIEVSANPFFGKLIDFHSVDQLGGGTSPTYPGPAIKFVNPFIIRTPPGVSCLIIPCINSMEKRFTPLGGLVDTDRYMTQINFPAIWNIPNYDGVLEAGTPLVTVIPVRRDMISAKPIIRPLNDKEFKSWKKVIESQRARSHVYTKELRDKRGKNEESDS